MGIRPDTIVRTKYIEPYQYSLPIFYSKDNPRLQSDKFSDAINHHLEALEAIGSELLGDVDAEEEKHRKKLLRLLGDPYVPGSLEMERYRGMAKEIIEDTMSKPPPPLNIRRFA
eukprot:TRINITY_DN8906_c0_g1_i4.p1 TRINITY_DN8906_c0_g1~~TRINITY_DN8906_c0_g1_i4.p1  ORF type:complete len:114 (+),score=21.58 TRINITY_DN8906_c0_g1_i4:94-435(+)